MRRERHPIVSPPPIPARHPRAELQVATLKPGGCPPMTGDMKRPTDDPMRDPDLLDVLADEPGRAGSFRDTLLDHPGRLVIPAVVGLLLGLLLGLVRTPEYTAESRLAVARVDVPTQALPGFSTGIENLAVTYSRLVTAEDVIEDASAELATTPGDIRSRITGSPIAESPLFRVEARGDSSEEAVATANATAQALQEYVASLNADVSDSARIFGLYKLAARDRLTAERRVRGVQSLVDRDNNPTNVRKLAGARSDLAAAELREDAIKELYQESLAGLASVNIIQVVNPARAADSDRGAAIRRLGFTGLLIGLAIGVLLLLLVPTPEPSGYQPKHARTS